MSELVGRTTEVARSVAVATGNGPEIAALIEGAAGIGKTVVLEAAMDAAEAAGALILAARPGEAETRMPLLGLYDLFSPVAADALASLPPAQRVRLEAALGMDRQPGGDPPDEGQLAVAVLGALRGLSTRRRVVIAIDDTQWLDSSTAAILTIALGRLRDADIRVVAAVRQPSTENPRLDVARLFRDRLELIALDGLGIGDLHRLLTGRLGAAVPRPTLIRIHEASRGNPFHALELARSLGPAGSAGTRLDVALPADIGSLLLRRIESLSPDARDALAVVALSPRPSNEALAKALDVSTARLDELAIEPVERGLLVVGERGLGLAHPLVGSAMRRYLGPRQVRGWHRRLAEVSVDEDEAAVHLSLGTTLPDAAVATALEHAAQRSLARGATVDAIDQLDRTIHLTPQSDSQDLVRRRLLLVRALVLAGDTRRAGTELDGLQIDAIGDPSMRAEAVLLLGVVQRYLGEHTAAIARHEDALNWTTDPALRARLHMRLAWFNEWDLGRALEHADRALELLDPEAAPLDYSFVLLLAARLRLHLGLAADHDAIIRGNNLQSAAADRDWNVSTTPIDWAIWMEDWPGARRLLDAGDRAAELAGDETLAGALIRRRVEVETWAGQLRLAGELVGSALDKAESTQQVPAIASARARRALILAHVGDVDAAEREAAGAYSLAEDFGSPIVLGYASTAVAAAAIARGDLCRVDEVLTGATAALDASGDVDQSAHRFHGDHLRALVGLGERDRAHDLVERLDRRGRLGPRPTWSGIAARGRAAIALSEGRLDQARAHIELALSFHAPQTVPIESAGTLRVAADIDRRLGRRRAAASSLAAALGILERIGAAGLADEVRVDLRRLAPDRGLRETLTPSEHRIAELAAEGLRNREIAARLGISEKTVEAALGRVYDKLQIRSRAQLGAALRSLANDAGA